MTYSIFHSTKALQVFLECFTALAIVLAWRYPGLAVRPYRRFESALGSLTTYRWRAIVAAGAFPLLIRLALLPVFPIPEPRVHDEFSYLLLSDTLAHHRLANPTPPYWQHFETEYELVRPSYASQYQPAQGVALAVGQTLLGNPWWGVWLSVGLMCAAICWSLSFAMPLRWALFSAVIAGLQFGVFGFWMNSYFGGAVPAIGGALIFAMLAARKPSVAVWAAAGLGIVIVLASRPAEGFIWLGIVAIAMLYRRTTWRCAGAMAIVLAAGAAGLGAYNHAITGNALESPYLAYRQDYGTPQSYWWQPPVIVSSFDHHELKANYQDQLRYWQRRYSASALWESTWRRLRDFWRFFIGPFLTPAALFALFAVRRKKVRVWFLVSLPFILDHATYHAWYPQQSASETVLILLLIVEGWRGLRVWRRRSGTGLALSRNLAAGLTTACALLCAGLVILPALPSSLNGVRRVWDTMSTTASARTLAIRRLNRIPGKHLVFVNYGPTHPWYEEWVFNGADLNESRIVFARMCTPESDRRLMDAFSDRDVWIASPDAGPLLARLDRSQLLLARQLIGNQDGNR